MPTFNGGHGVKALVASLAVQSVRADVFFVDSSSTDGTLEYLKTEFDNVRIIPSALFNHGGTRQWMVDINPSYDYYIFITQDAYLDDATSISEILRPFSDPKVGAVCGRQLPHKGASAVAAHARFFNYPGQSSVRSYRDRDRLGLKAAFLSNSFAAYRRIALDSVGGFPSDVIFGEDMYVAGKLLISGWKVAYAAEALCRHSHDYTLWQEFKRYFDMGVFHVREPWLGSNFGGVKSEGLRFLLSELKFLGFRAIGACAYSVLRNVLKYAGYKFGINEHLLPLRIKLVFTMNRTYWHQALTVTKMSDRSDIFD